MKFLITGGAGQLGRAVCLLISESGHDAVAFDLPHISWDHITDVEIIRGDITDIYLLQKPARISTLSYI